MLQCHEPTISRELQRTGGSEAYDTSRARCQREAPRVALHRVPKIQPDSTLFLMMRLCLQLRWSPQQIAAILKSMWPDDSSKMVFHETIYNALYLHLRGGPKREMIAWLRHHNQVRKPRSRGVDRRGLIKDMQSIHIRPP